MNIFHKVTLKTLQKNRTRTLVTIVGIILSASMFTAVTTMVSSLSHYLIQSSLYNDGNWYGAGFGLSAESKDQLASDSHTKQSVSLELLGFASIKEKTANESKPFICVYGIQSDFTDLMPVHLTQGRLPKNNREILLPEHLKLNGGIACTLDESLTLTLGTRTDREGNILINQDAHLNTSENREYTETFTPSETRTYTVVGFYERPSYED